MNRLKNKVALITGGAKGLGASIAHHFFNEGAKIILCDINLDEALKTAKKIKWNCLLYGCFKLQKRSRCIY
jgi:NAD(P)-dependent dehydrogenase (short-subunit alcohol dehydrogenase family)